ncbi:MAG: LolA family protein [Sediminibacterium sp.]
MKKYQLFICFIFCVSFAIAQDAGQLIKTVKAKLERVDNYQATGVMKTDIAFIKAPIGKIKIYFKKPNLFKIKKEGGISLLPKGGLSVNLSSLIASSNYTTIDAGVQAVGTKQLRVVKLLPNEETSDVVITTLYIYEKESLIEKAITTTKENGTYTMYMNYGAYSNYGLPDKVVFEFNTKNYKLPKGITLEFEDDSKPLSAAQQLKNKKGRVEISYKNYSINKGIAANIFN